MAFISPSLLSRPNYSASTFANTGPTHKGSERNFKKDLIKLLQKDGVPGNQIKEIFRYLQKGADQQIGTKLRAMMSMQPPLIRPQLAEAVAKAASVNGVPNSSINKQELLRPISPEEAQGSLGRDLDDFTNRLGMPSIANQSLPGFAGQMRQPSTFWMSA